MTTHLASFAAALGLVLGGASAPTLAQSTSSTTTTSEQRTTPPPKAANPAATKATTKRWDGASLKPVDERANAKPAAHDAVRNAPANGESAAGTGCHHAKADDA